MTAILLIVIYLAFISLGLPDSLLGSAWPSIYGSFQVPVSWAGIISMIIAGGTILSSLVSDRVIHQFGTGKVTLVSVALTAAALFGFSVSGAFWQLCLWGVPYGLGAGSVDAALNNFVALHYKSRHMNWLHCFWGIGATAGPYIMGFCLSLGLAWTAGYRTVGLIQAALVIVLFLSLPLWKQEKQEQKDIGASRNVLSPKQALKLPGAKLILAAFFCYCSLEAAAGLWAASFFVLAKGINATSAAKWAAFFYLGITLGRLFSGFIADRFGDRKMIRCGQIILLAGICFMLLPAGKTASLFGLVLIGLGCAPIYPSLLHETPKNFGAENSQSLMGMQMACAYIGSTLVPPLFGLISNWTGMALYPAYLLLFAVMMILAAEAGNRKVRSGKISAGRG